MMEQMRCSDTLRAHKPLIDEACANPLSWHGVYYINLICVLDLGLEAHLIDEK